MDFENSWNFIIFVLKCIYLRTNKPVTLPDRGKKDEWIKTKHTCSRL